MSTDFQPDPQELARRFNEAEAVWRRYEARRAQRHVPGLKSSAPLPEAILDALDWEAAEREGRPVRAVGHAIPHTP